MKRLFLILALLLGVAWAQSTTPNLNMGWPAHGAANWDTQTVNNSLIIDNIFTIPSCGDATHAVGWNFTTKQLTCQLITTGIAAAGGTNGQLQLNNSGLFGGLANVASGSELVSQGVSSAPAFQTKPILDVRDISGIDCTFTNDSSTALNTLTDNTTGSAAAQNGKAITFPPNCHIKLTNTWITRNLSGFSFRGVSGAGANGFYNTNVPTISWCGAAGGTMMDMQWVDGFLVENLAIDGAGSGCANSASVGINVDKFVTCAGCVNTTDGRFRRLQINASTTGTPTAQANWSGIQFSMLQSNNVENMVVEDSTFYCQGGASSAAIIIGPSANAKGFVIERNGFSTCKYSIDAKGGTNNVIRRNFFSPSVANGSDLLLDGASQQLTFEHNRSEPTVTSAVLINSTGAGGGNCPGLVIMGNEFAVAGRSGGGGTTFDMSNCNSSTGVTLIGNIWDNLAGEVPIKGNASNRLVSLGNTYPNATAPLFTTFATGALSFGDNSVAGGGMPYQIFSGSGSSWEFNNNSTANSGNNFNSVPVNWDAPYWTGSASALDKMTWQNTLGTGANPPVKYTLAHTGSTGAVSICFLTTTCTSSIAGTDNYQFKTPNCNAGVNDNGGSGGWFSLTCGAITGIFQPDTGSSVTFRFGAFSNHPLNLVTNNVNRWQLTTAGHLLALTDNTFDIGAAGATRPRTGYFGTSVVSPSFISVSGPLSGNWQCTNVTPVTVNANVTTDQNLMACTIPAGILNSALKNLRISSSAGVYSTPAASTTAITVKLKLCTVSGCGSGTVISLLNITTTALAGIQATNDQFNLTGVSTTQTAGASSAYEAHGSLLIDLGVGNTVADSMFADTNTATVGTIDSTVQLFLQETIAFSVASASNSATQRQLVVDTVN
jgi:hypothetical protein